MHWKDGNSVSWTVGNDRRFWTIRTARVILPWTVHETLDSGVEMIAGGFWTRRGAKRWAERQGNV